MINSQQKAIKRRTRRKIMHVCSVVFLIATVLFAIFRFAPVLTRFLQAINDLILSIGYYGLFFVEQEGLITPSVQVIPENIDVVLPLSFAELEELLLRFWSLFKNPDNVTAYFEMLLRELNKFANGVMIFALPMLAVFLVIYFTYKKVEKKQKVKKGQIRELDSRPLKKFKKIRKAVWLPMKNTIQTYAGFLGRKKAYIWFFAILWAYNLNLITIVLEAAAYIFYVAVSLDYLNIFSQVAKLVADLSVAVTFLPWWLQVFITYKLVDAWRSKIGDKRVDGYMAKNEGFIEEHPGALFIVGKQRSKKTSLLVTLKKVFERRFRKKAKEKFAQRDKQFPFFPWAVIEETVKKCRENKTFIILEDVEIFAEKIRQTIKEKGLLKYKARRDHLQEKGLLKYKARRDHLQEKYGFNIDYVVNYIEEGYPTIYDNGTVETSLFKAIERYAQLYMIHSQLTPLDVSNLSIREDYTFVDYGFFPIFDGKYLRKTKESKKNSRYSHIIPYDAFRPGKVFDEKTRYDIAIEYGIGCMTEAAKERKNRYTRQGDKSKDNDVACQDNDLFELDTKMRGHVATIDNFDFWVWLMDDQRFDAMGADSKELTTQVMIKHTSDAKVVLPFATLDEAVYILIAAIRDKIHYFLKNRKGKRTLLDHLLNVVHNIFFRHWDRIKSRYGLHTVTVKTVDGQDNELLGEAEKLYIPVGVTYNDTFATDSCRTYYRHKHRKAKVSLNGVEQYQSIYPSRKNYRNQKSYFDKDMSGVDGRKRYVKAKVQNPKEPNAPTGEVVKRGRGRPKNSA